MGFCKFTKSGNPASVSGDRKSLTLRGVPQGHLLRDAAIRSFPARRRIPTPVTRSLARNDRKRDVGDAVPYNGSPHPSAGGDAHIAPPDKCAFCGGTHGSRPTGYAGHAGRDGGDAVPYNGSSHPPAGDDTHTSPRRQHKEAGASACLSVVRLFTWRSWRPHDRRGRPSDSAP